MGNDWGKVGKINVALYSVLDSASKKLSKVTEQVYDELDYSNLPEDFISSSENNDNDVSNFSNASLAGEDELIENYLKMLEQEIEYWENELDNYDLNSRLRAFEGTDIASEFHLIPWSALYGDQAGTVLTPELVAKDVWRVANEYLVYPGDTYLVDDIKQNTEYWENALDVWCMQYYGQSFLQFMTINEYLSDNLSMINNGGSDLSEVKLQKYTMDDFIAEIASEGSGFGANSMANSDSAFYSIYCDGHADELIEFLGKCFLQNYTARYNQSINQVEVQRAKNQESMDYYKIINQKLAEKEYMRYSLIQHRKEMDFIQENIDELKYSEYINNLSDEDRVKIILSSMLVFEFGSADDVFKYMSEETINRFCYLYENYGNDKANDYLKIIEDKVNNAKGLKEADEFAESIEKNGYIDKGLVDSLITANSGFFDGTQSFEEGLLNWFKKEGIKSANDYAMMYKMLYLQEKGYLKDVYNISSSIGNMAIPMIASMALSTIDPTAASVVGNTLRGASSGGNAYNDALISGNDRMSSYAYGILSGLSEPTVGLLLGNIPWLNANAKLSLQGILSEGFEEAIQSYVDAGLRCAVLGESIDISNLNHEALQSLMYGMITSGILNGGKLSMDSYNTFKSGGINVSNYNDLIDCYMIMNNPEIVVKNDGDKRCIYISENVSSSDIDMIRRLFSNDLIIGNTDVSTSYVYNDLTGGIDIAKNTNNKSIESHILYPVHGDNVSMFKRLNDIVSGDVATTNPFKAAGDLNDVVPASTSPFKIAGDLDVKTDASDLDAKVKIKAKNLGLDSNNQIIMSNDNFDNFFRENFADQYSLGVHGIDGQDFWVKNGEQFQLDYNAISEAKKSIIDDGLYFQKDRTLHSTVRFGDLGDYLVNGYYDAGGVIIALPKTMKNSIGDYIALGESTEIINEMDRNHSSSSLADKILPNSTENGGTLDSMFILGTYEKLPNGMVKFEINPGHIYFNDGVVPDDFYDAKKRLLQDNDDSN